MCDAHTHTHTCCGQSMKKMKLTMHWLPIKSFDKQINSTDSLDQCDWYVIQLLMRHLAVLYVYRLWKHSRSKDGCQWVSTAASRRAQQHCSYRWKTCVFIIFKLILTIAKIEAKEAKYDWNMIHQCRDIHECQFLLGKIMLSSRCQQLAFGCGWNEIGQFA